MSDRLNELKREMDSWRGINTYIFGKARDEYKALLAQSGDAKKASKLPTAEELKEKTVAELKDQAKGLGIPGYYKLKEAELIKGILKKLK